MDSDEPLCRFCFEGVSEGPLIQPCNCSGSSAYLHLTCLRKWQRMVVVDQHTHPAFYEDDVRHHICNTCKAPYTCPPPTRAELMMSFTGPEIASLLGVNRIIGSHAIFSDTLGREVEGASEQRVRLLQRSYVHWIRGAYLITNVDADKGYLDVDLTAGDFRLLCNLKESIKTEGRTYELEMNEDLKAVVDAFQKEAEARDVDDNDDEGGSTVAPPPPPAHAQSLYASIMTSNNGSVKIRYVDPSGPSYGDDHIKAVNLARPLAELSGTMSRRVEQVYKKVKRRRPAFQFDEVGVVHYSGGPCDDDKIVRCLVLGGNGSGWTSVGTLEAALLLASRRREGEGELWSGRKVEVKGLKSRDDLNGELGICLKFREDLGRWNVRLRNGLGVQIKPENLTVKGCEERGEVMVFWGDARWTRAQLLGEIARGHWGLCKADVTDILREQVGVWKGLDGRMVFAPVTAMTDADMLRSREEMENMRRNFLEGGGSSEGESEDEEEGDGEDDDGDEDPMRMTDAEIEGLVREDIEEEGEG
ncbi:hypothetical protein TrST_g6741 [Triparma strigata]|uniref:RING-CH-type domain-containing protein n=1 Tax=Triparma strigata TaxID=1606541 RepID=A0A9W7EYX1_9STRA|nr:hypothetical protein TrST_g6741 [Triparma strigata]